MKLFFFISLLVFFFPLGLAAEGGKGFRYFDDDCDINNLGNLVFEKGKSENYQEKYGAYLGCFYSLKGDFSLTKSKVQIKYTSFASGFYEIHSFENSDAALSYFNGLKDEYKKDNFLIKDAGKNKWLLQKDDFRKDDPQNPHRLYKLMYINNNSAVIGSYDYYRYLTRSLALDTKLSKSFIEAIEEEFRKEKIDFFLEDFISEVSNRANAMVAKKEFELGKREEIEKYLQEWQLGADKKAEEFKNQRHFWSRSACLIFDGLGLPLDFLEKLKIINPYKSCAYYLYWDLAGSKGGLISNPKIDDFVHDYQNKKIICVNEKVLGVYQTKIADWNLRQMSYSVEDLKICRNGCEAGEEIVICD